MKILSGEMVRRMHEEEGKKSICADQDTFVTRQALEYIRANGLILEEVCAAALQASKVEKEAKPEHMTHLHGSQLVRKDHPRIILRGRMDSLQSMVLELQIKAKKAGYEPMVEELQSVLLYCRNILGSEVGGKPLGKMDLLGLDEKQLREMSQHPKRHFNVEHVMPSYEMGEIYIGLNSLRTKVRETELAAITAFCHDEGIEREDILRALNRLSSGIYIMMCKELAGSYLNSRMV